MGRYSHLPAVLLALLADAAPRAYAHPILRASLAARQTNNANNNEDKKTSGPNVAAITGTAIGAGVIFFIFCFIVFWVYKRKPGMRGKQRRKDVERGDAQRDGQQGGPQRVETRRREEQWPAVAPVQPLPAEHVRSASESPAFLPVMGEQKREQVYKKGQQQQQQQKKGREQGRDQKQKPLKRSQTYPSPHQFAAELPAGEDLRRPPMARINGFNMVLPPLLPPPTRPPNHPLPPTPPPNQPLPAPPTQQQQQQPPLYTPLHHPTPPPTHPLPPIPTPTRPPRPDTPQLPPIRTLRPSRQNLFTGGASPPRLSPLNTQDVRTPATPRPRAGTGPREISPRTVLIPIHHQEQPQPQPQPQATPPHQGPPTPQQRPHTPQRPQYQQPAHQHPPQQPAHPHHQRDQSQQTLIPSPDSAWSLSTFGGGNNSNSQQDNNNYHHQHHRSISAVTGTHADRFPVSPETPSGGTTGTVYVAFGERAPTQQRTRKTSVWTLHDSSDWPVPLAMTRPPAAADGRPRQAGGGSGGR